MIPVTGSTRFAKLPLLVGDDARKPRRRSCWTCWRASPSSRRASRAAVRVGGRRWNLRIDNGIDVVLPEDDPAAHGPSSPRLERSSAMLQRDVRAVDLRLPDRLVVRVAPEPAKEPPTAKKGRPPAKNT